jgi:hypothetical protein
MKWWVTGASSEDDAPGGYGLTEAAKDLCSCCWAWHFACFMYSFGVVEDF